MSWGMVAVAAATVVGGLVNANAQKKAAKGAANAQQEAAQIGLSEQQRQFDKIQEILKPYSTGGYGSVNAQQAMLGLSGPEAQQKAIQGIQQGPTFQALNKQGQEAILQNASATGGLRGGNTQAALAQFSPNLLNSLINQQFSQLGSLSSLGANAAAMQGQAGQNYANQVTAGQGQIGAAQAGQAMATGQANAGLGQMLPGLAGMFAGGGGSGGGMGGMFGGLFGGGKSAAGGGALSSTPMASMAPNSGGSLFGKLGF